MKYLTPLLALALLGCDGGPNTGSDGYQFEGREKGWPNDLPISVIEHKTVVDMRRAGKVAGAKIEQGRELNAWSSIDGKCVIHIVSPETVYAPEWPGHELMHCKYGRWHK